jgi:enoyl-[acyl-carrier protein] reductase II
MGTRFATSRESPVHADTKQLIIDKPAEDTIYSKNFDTFPCRVMRTPGGRKYTARRLSPPVALSRSIQAALEMDRPLTDLARDAMSQGAVNAVKIAYFGAATLAMRKAIHEGNHEEGVQLIGQSQGLIHDVPSVAEIVQRVLAEASAVIGALPRD